MDQSSCFSAAITRKKMLSHSTYQVRPTPKKTETTLLLHSWSNTYLQSGEHTTRAPLLNTYYLTLQDEHTDIPVHRTLVTRNLSPKATNVYPHSVSYAYWQWSFKSVLFLLWHLSTLFYTSLYYCIVVLFPLMNTQLCGSNYELHFVGQLICCVLEKYWSPTSYFVSGG